VSRQTWAPRGPWRYLTSYRALVILALFIATRPGPIIVVIGLLGVVYIAREVNVSLVLDPGHAVVRNTFRTYRVPYGDILRVEQKRKELRLVTRLRVVRVEASGWFSDADRAAMRDALVELTPQPADAR
jgi:hypothetical protein